ncbi:beach domain-containing protein [Anaeramoeba flamelloides]|uniref:Beach domain-containing protein n=1 Tax=Anaeramoeba flamelloides TaxID=1746091 RepID=A0AAV7Y486_9EUKA|nr:beach domain-containing protein [Anaeramoeba flamelloides]
MLIFNLFKYYINLNHNTDLINTDEGDDNNYDDIKSNNEDIDMEDNRNNQNEINIDKLNNNFKIANLVSLIKAIFVKYYPFLKKNLKDENNQKILTKDKQSSKLLSSTHLEIYSLINTPSWKFAIEKNFLPIYNYFEKNILDLSINFGELLIKNLNELIFKLEKNTIQEKVENEKNQHQTKKHLNGLIKKLKYKYELRNQYIQNSKKHSKFLWKLTLIKLDNERAIWGNSFIDYNNNTENNEQRENIEIKDENNLNGNKNENNNKNEKENEKNKKKIKRIYWKIDYSEDYLRRRKRLRRNYHFNPHLDAIIRRDERIIKKSDKLINEFNSQILEQKKQNWNLISKILTIQSKDEEDIEINQENDFLIEDQFEELNKKKKFLMDVDCQLILPCGSVNGTLEISKSYLHFFSIQLQNDDDDDNDNNNSSSSSNNNNDNDSDSKNNNETEERIWELNSIIKMKKISFRLQRSAIEFFLDDNRNFLLNFEKKSINKVFKFIVGLKPKKLKNSQILFKHPKVLIKKSQITKKWLNREISNFEYLMKLNFIAGRTYNDLSQYPVFPWVLCNYDSETLDLNDPKNYRDLSKPIGALNPKRFVMFNDMYESLQDEEGDIPPFFYGSHYLNAASVLYYLLRIEPFTTWGIDLHGGKFDNPDRNFGSISQTWKNCLNLSADVKELIPEFYYFPEFLENSNDFDLGKLHNGKILNDVKLPPWAKNSPEEFTRIMREALESDYVSDHLHEWIDLIFGYKQRGEEAFKAKNVFYYLTYEGAVDFDLIENQVQKQGIIDQINNFGQCCSQLFTKPHPKRISKDKLNIKEKYIPKAGKVAHFQNFKFNKTPLYYICNFNSDQIISLDKEGNFTISNLIINKTILSNQQKKKKNEKLINDENNEIGNEAIDNQQKKDNINNDDNIESKKNDNNDNKDDDGNDENKKEKEKEKEQENENENENQKENENEKENEKEKENKNNNHEKNSQELINNGKENKKNKNKDKEGMKNKIQINFQLTFGLKKKIGCPFANKMKIFSNCFFLIKSSKCFISSGYFDNSFKIINAESGNLIQSISVHKDAVTTISFENNILVTGSRDTTVIVWEFLPKLNKVNNTPKQILYGHDDEVNCVDINYKHDLIISSSSDGTCIMNSIGSGQYIRTIYPKNSKNITFCKVLPNGMILLYSQIQKLVWMYSINGKLLSHQSSQSVWRDWKISKNGQVLVTIGVPETIQIWLIKPNNLLKVNAINTEGIPNSIELIEKNNIFIVGFEDGNFLAGVMP